MGESNPKPANFRSLVGVEVTLCADVKEGDCEEDLGGGDATVLADLEGGGPDGVLLGDTLDFALSAEEILSFFAVD